MCLAPIKNDLGKTIMSKSKVRHNIIKILIKAIKKINTQIYVLNFGTMILGNSKKKLFQHTPLVLPKMYTIGK